METRPWGWYQILFENNDTKVKRIFVNAGGKLSYQMHHKRNEVWAVVKGQGYVVIDEVIQRIGAGSVVQIPAGRRHRVVNDHDSDSLEFIEVQTGEYFGEDDIVRFIDDYGRS